MTWLSLNWSAATAMHVSKLCAYFKDVELLVMEYLDGNRYRRKGSPVIWSSELYYACVEHLLGNIEMEVYFGHSYFGWVQGECFWSWNAFVKILDWRR